MKEDFSTLTKKQLKNAPKLKLFIGKNTYIGKSKIDTKNDIKVSDTSSIKIKSDNQKIIIDMGTHRVGSKFSDTVKIKNEGKEELIIKRIVPECSCITFKINKNKLKKGEEATIIFTYDSINQDSAKYQKYLSIYTNDPTYSIIKLSFITKLIF